MTTYCKLGDKNSIVNYEFSGQQEKTLKIKNAPIDVTTIEKPANNFKYEIITEVKRTWRRYADPKDIIDIQSYQFTNYSNYLPTSIYFEPTDYRYVGDGYGMLGTENVFLNTSNGIIQGGSNTPANYSSNIVPGSAVAYYVKQDSVGTRCESKTDSARIVSINEANINRCSINISFDNKSIYTDKGNCPVTYTVVCGEECPPGTTKCLSTNYPGYCCLPCDPIKAEIKAIASIVRSINNG